ncbi:MAG: alpha/beta hydrolase-fold protein [Phototrophicaceae bacterium]
MIKLEYIIILTLFILIGMTVTAQENSESQVLDVNFDSETLGRTYQYKVYLPADYDNNEQNYPVVYLLHGRGDTMSAWLNVRSTLNELISNGDIPPMIAILPDMPSSDRGNYYVDSVYTGMLYRAEAVETAFFNDLIPHVDNTYRTLANRESRVIGGYSMGGYGAIRYSLAHPDMFMGAIVLSPAVYTPLPPADSSTREFGSFGDDASLFNEEIYTNLNYPALLTTFSGEYRLNMFIAVGDDEWKHPNPEDMEHDLDFESHRLFNRVSRVPSISAEFRVYDGGHDWDVWQPGFVEGITYLSNYLDTDDGSDDAASALDGWSIGTSGEDFAGGIDVDDTGSIYQALAVSGSLMEQQHIGNLDIAIVKYNPDRSVQWVRQLGTVGNDRPYGIAVTSQQEVVVIGYTQGDLDGQHSDNESDDIFVIKLNAEGDIIWQTQFGTSEADRAYALTLTSNDAIIITGYTKGDLAGDNAGDKDIITAMLSAEGEILWMIQIGGDGEDKGQAVDVANDGTIYTAGMTTSILIDNSGGGIDAVIIELTGAGEVIQIHQFGTSEWDEITGAIVDTNDNLIVTGFTALDLAGNIVGDKDMFMAVFDVNFEIIFIEQIGTNLNDKGAAITLNDAGDILITGYTDGEFINNTGDFDLILLQYNSAYERIGTWQLGTPERDGTDQWAEKNLFITTYEDRIFLSALTLGNIADSTISGGSDVFVIEITRVFTGE